MDLVLNLNDPNLIYSREKLQELVAKSVNLAFFLVPILLIQRNVTYLYLVN